MVLVLATSKVPFYIAGAVLVIWAVVASAVGINRAAFPGGTRGQWGVTLITLVLAAIAIAFAITTA